MPVYFIAANSHQLTPVKIGVSKNIPRRLRQLQTASPSPLVLMGWLQSSKPFDLEKELHHLFQGQRLEYGEWFDLDRDDVLDVLFRAGRDGYIAKNADAFQLVGYDQDAVPEYLGICDWVDLEIEDCCPFCGCLCGMFFQDASQMYHCIACDELTDFSDLSAECFS